MNTHNDFPHDFPHNRPHVAYILLWYPLFTQPFIFREVETLREQGQPLTVFALYGKHLYKCSPAMQQAAHRTRTHGIRLLLPILWALCVQCFTRPRLLFGLIWRWMFRRWTNIEVLGENAWGFVAGVYLARRLVEEGIDIVYAPWPRGASTAALVASALSGIPFGLSARGDNIEPADPDFVDKLKAASFIRANNKADVDRMRALLPPEQASKITLVYNGVSVTGTDFCPLPIQKPVRLLALGRFDVTKGFEYLLEACAILRDQGFAFRCTLAGGGGRSIGLGYILPRLEMQRRRLGLEKLVDMPGLITHEHVSALFCEHNIFVAPCVIHASGRRDGIPNTIIEAAAHAMPVISTETNAIPEVVHHGHTGLLVPQKDSAALATAIRTLAENPEKARQMGYNGRALVLRMFDPIANAHGLMDMFRAIPH